VDGLDSSTGPDLPFAEGRMDTLDPDLRHRLVSETAYHSLAERGFAEGSEVDDWGEAEDRVDHVSVGPHTEPSR
jgi:hypothetical protein